MIGLTKFAALSALSAFLPAALACKGWEGGVPTPTATHSNKKVIEVAAGEVFDGGWARYDRGKGACHDQAEGGELPSHGIGRERR